jgi:hypothetical protein
MKGGSISGNHGSVITGQILDEIFKQKLNYKFEDV